MDWLEPHGIKLDAENEIWKGPRLLKSLLSNILIPEEYCTLPGPQIVINVGYCVIYSLIMIEEYISLSIEEKIFPDKIFVKLLDADYIHTKMVDYMSFIDSNK